MLSFPAVIYALLCLLVAYRGRRTHLGYIGTLLLSTFLTPILVFIGLLIFTPPPEDVHVIER